MCGKHEHCKDDKCMCGENECEEGQKCVVNHQGEKECTGNYLHKNSSLGKLDNISPTHSNCLLYHKESKS